LFAAPKDNSISSLKDKSRLSPRLTFLLRQIRPSQKIIFTIVISMIKQTRKADCHLVQETVREMRPTVKKIKQEAKKATIR
jgi:hypothetical protein